jgi:hypothetical protein
LYFWIDARNSNRGRSLDDALKHHIKSAHPENAKWSIDIVRSSMLTQLMLEVHAPATGENLQSLLLRFADMSSQFRKYTALEQLHISLRPHYNNAHHKVLFRSFKMLRLQEKTVKESWTMRRLCRAARQIKTQLPPKCNVKWYMPGKKLRKVPYKRRDFLDSEDPPEVMDSDLNVIEFMEALWVFVCERSDRELDNLLSEQESQSAWRLRQSK